MFDFMFKYVLTALEGLLFPAIVSMFSTLLSNWFDADTLPDTE